jgi:hypothetical protein
MAKIERQDITEIVEITPEMIKAIKRDIKNFTRYDDFLYSVEAIKKSDFLPSVLQYRNEYLEDYENKFIKKYIGNSLNNMFVFKKYANVQKNIASEGKPQYVDTGYFMPRSFWDFVSKQKI